MPAQPLTSFDDYTFDFIPIHPLCNRFQFVLDTSSEGEGRLNQYSFDLDDKNSSEVLQTLLELECVSHLLDYEYCNLFLYLGCDLKFDPHNPYWKWIDHYPYDIESDQHYGLDFYQLYHYDQEGKQTQINFRNPSLTQEIQKLNHAHNSEYKTQCQTIIEREILSFKIKSQNLNKKTHKI